MSIDWSAFTPWQSLAGGALIGMAASVLILFNGRIAGISGILGGLLKRPTRDTGWRLAFLLGLAMAPIVYTWWRQPVELRIDAGPLVLIGAGFLVGIGTRYGSGCTSGHGVCGISRLSSRSLVATGIFMFAGMATVTLLRHLLLR